MKSEEAACEGRCASSIFGCSLLVCGAGLGLEMYYALLPFKRFSDFSGRSRRKEYWHFVLLLIVVSILASLLDVVFGLGGSLSTSAHDLNFSFNLRGGVLAMIWLVVTIIPGLAVSIRRLHDIDRTGWWVFISLIPLIGWIIWIVFMCLDGSTEQNRFGPNPKVIANAG